MSTAIALLSGKGGSGKTTLALSIADLLSKCDVSTLLVDCDMSTHGATYFFETQLVEKNHREHTEQVSFSDLLTQKELWTKDNIFLFKPNFCFIPSVAEISSQELDVTNLNYLENVGLLEEFLFWARNEFDVILFDCQAGYTPFLSKLLPHMDVDLFVLEADSISASAMRSLHLKIGNSFGKARLYQVFNKASDEEYDIYSKIVGTFFTNIGTLRFDWKIRQAFSRAQIPDIEKVGGRFGLSLCDICRLLVQDSRIERKIVLFSAELLSQQLESERLILEQEITFLNENSRGQQKTRLLSFILCMFSLVVAIIGTLFDSSMFEFGMESLLSVCLCFFAAAVVFLIVVDDGKKKREARRKHEQEIRIIDKKLYKLRRALDDEKSNL